MTLLFRSELASMRATADSALPDVCAIARCSSSPDGQGGVNAGWDDDFATGVPCRLAPAGRAGEEREREARVAAESDWVVTIPAGQDVDERDRLTIGARTFEVVAVHAQSWEISRRVECKEVE